MLSQRQAVTSNARRFLHTVQRPFGPILGCLEQTFPLELRGEITLERANSGTGTKPLKQRSLLTCQDTSRETLDTITGTPGRRPLKVLLATHSSDLLDWQIKGHSPRTNISGWLAPRTVLLCKLDDQRSALEFFAIEKAAGTVCVLEKYQN